jgi:hypothetical protein
MNILKHKLERRGFQTVFSVAGRRKLFLATLRREQHIR